MIINDLQAIITLDKECREWCYAVSEVAVRELTSEPVIEEDTLMYTNRSVHHRARSSWVFFPRIRSKVAAEQIGAHRSTT